MSSDIKDALVEQELVRLMNQPVNITPTINIPPDRDNADNGVEMHQWEVDLSLAEDAKREQTENDISDGRRLVVSRLIGDNIVRSRALDTKLIEEQRNRYWETVHRAWAGEDWWDAWAASDPKNKPAATTTTTTNPTTSAAAGEDTAAEKQKASNDDPVSK